MNVLTTFLVVLLAASACNAATCPPRTSDPVPSNPGIPGRPDPSTLDPLRPAGCSEVFNIPTMGSGTPSWPRVNCPHLAAGLTDFETAHPGVGAGSNVVITGRVLLKSCSLANPSAIINRITIQNGAELVIDDSDVVLNVREILVEDGGSLLAGSSTCRRYGSLHITFHGTKASSDLANFNYGNPTKGLLSRGTVDLHGKQYHPTWTRLARTAEAGQRLIYLQDPVNWEVGQQILVTTSMFFDCPPEWQDSWCSSTPHQNEVLTITGLVMDGGASEYVVQVSSNLAYSHYAGSEYQVEVALLTRRIVLEGSKDDPASVGFGGHTLVTAPGIGRFSGVQAEEMGQLNVEARYPFHIHMMGEDASHSYVEDCVVTNSHFRGYVIHGTNNTRLSRNVAYNVKGMTYYLEDAVEENNLIEYNLAAHVHPIYRPANGGVQSGDYFSQRSDLFNPADTSASGFYIPNAYNTFIGNAASGGWSGFAFPNCERPLGIFRDRNWHANNPERRPVLQFEGNTAHSNGFYWYSSGSAFYVGARLQHDGFSGPLTYMSGRNDRTTSASNGDTVWMRFVNNKAFLTNIAWAHWGNQVELIRFEGHDIVKGAMLFGEAVIDDALFNARSGNTNGMMQVENSRGGKLGFQFYDTWVKTILSRVTFRGFKATTPSGSRDYAVSYMTHSDHYTPQGINSVRGLRFEDTDESIIVRLGNCGETLCPGDGPSTMSSRMYSVLDWDGSYSRTGQPTIMGSNLEWWNVGGSVGCTYNSDWNVWNCPWRENMQTAYLQTNVADLYSSCDGSVSSTCTDQYADYTVGTMSLWGRPSASIALSPWAGVTGHANTGWHWHVQSARHGIDGAPSSFSIGGGFQIAAGNFVVLSMRYPSSTTFRVYLESNWWGITYDDMPMASKAEVLRNTEDLGPSADCPGSPWYAFCTNTGGVGPAWHFDGTHLFLRIVAPGCYNQNARSSCLNDGWYEYDGIRVWDINGGFSYNVEASCSGCSVQSSYGGVTFWNVPDQNSPPAFNMAPGAVRTDTGGAPGATSSQTCPPPTGEPSCAAIPNGGSGTSSYSSSCAGTTTASGGTCTLTCNTGGYSGSATRTCNAGTWTTATPTCTASECGPIPPGGSGTNSYDTTCSSGNTASGGTCLLTCDTTGYSGSATRTCSAGTWSSQTPTCAASACAAIPPGGSGTNSYSTSCSTGPTPSGGTCTLTCNTGGYSGSATRSCSAGSWSSQSLTCTGNPCGSISAGGSGTASFTTSCQTGSTAHGGTCTLSCSTSGYSGAATRTCTAGAWSSQTPSCSPNSCGPLSAGGSGTNSYTTTCSSGNTAHSGTCTLTCDTTGYSGSATRTCSAGTWSSQAPTCSPDVCTEEPAAAGSSSSCSGNSVYGDSCTWTCQSGYSGASTTRTCGADGVWSGQQITCTAAGSFTCSASPSAPTNGYIVFTAGDNHDSTASFRCLTGFRYSGVSSVTCSAPSAPGVWPIPTPTPTCTATVCTNAPTPPANGQVTFSDGNLHDSVATFTCDAGFEQSGSRTLLCSAPSEDASWPSSDAACTAVAYVCNFPPDPPVGGEVTFSSGNDHGSVATFSCSGGLTLRGEASVTCAALDGDTQWPTPMDPPVCLASCTNPPVAPADGSVSFSDGEVHGSVAAFSCNAGFVLSGDTFVTCDASSGAADWPAAAPVCTVSMYVCLSPPAAPVGGSVSFSAGNMHNSVATFSCDAGLTLVGDESVTCYAPTSDTNWPTPSVLPSCQTIDLCTGVTCPPVDQCHEEGTCDPATGECVPVLRPEGSACDDGDVGTVESVCTVDGLCVDNALCMGVTCPGATECRAAATCNPLTGTCSARPLDDGTPCEGSGSCLDGECAVGAGIVENESADSDETILSGGALYGVIAGGAACCLFVLAGVAFLAGRNRDPKHHNLFEAYELNDEPFQKNPVAPPTAGSFDSLRSPPVAPPPAARPSPPPPSAPVAPPRPSLSTKTGEALYDFEAYEDGQVSVYAGDKLSGVNDLGDGWTEVTCNGYSGVVPSSYVKIATPGKPRPPPPNKPRPPPPAARPPPSSGAGSTARPPPVAPKPRAGASPALPPKPKGPPLPPKPRY